LATPHVNPKLSLKSYDPKSIRKPHELCIYWDGKDIFDTELFAETSAPSVDYLELRQLKYAQSCLRYGVGQVAAGNATSVNYQIGTEFGVSQESGTLVITDTEHLTRTVYDDADYKPPVWPPKKRQGPSITKPYSSYWRMHQDFTEDPISIGEETLALEDDIVTYSRYVAWGVVVEQDDTKLLQPFSFRTTKLLPSGKIYTPKVFRREPAISGHALELPISVGEVTADALRRSVTPGYSMHSLNRTRSVEVVYPASGSRNVRRQRSYAGRLLSVFGIGHA